MPAIKKVELVRPIQATAVDHQGVSYVFNRKDLLAGDHPVVRAHPKLFETAEPTRDRPVVEQATAAPGEVRSG